MFPSPNATYWTGEKNENLVYYHEGTEWSDVLTLNVHVYGTRHLNVQNNQQYILFLKGDCCRTKIPNMMSLVKYLSSILPAHCVSLLIFALSLSPSRSLHYAEVTLHQKYAYIRPLLLCMWIFVRYRPFWSSKLCYLRFVSFTSQE